MAGVSASFTAAELEFIVRRFVEGGLPMFAGSDGLVVVVGGAQVAAQRGPSGGHEGVLRFGVPLLTAPPPPSLSAGRE